MPDGLIISHPHFKIHSRLLIQHCQECLLQPIMPTRQGGVDMSEIKMTNRYFSYYIKWSVPQILLVENANV